jgi:hypothetical protein
MTIEEVESVIVDLSCRKLSYELLKATYVRFTLTPKSYNALKEEIIKRADVTGLNMKPKRKDRMMFNFQGVTVLIVMGSNGRDQVAVTINL